MRPGHPEGDMPRSLGDLKGIGGEQGWSHPMWVNPPWLWLPFTDMFSSWFTNCNNRCGKLELAAMECMEYYGFKNGKVICKDHYEDFMECRWKKLEHMRNYAMKTKHFQRYYEYKKGVRDFDSVFIPVPKAFAYEEPAINPRYNE